MSKKSYTKPQLSVHGNVEQITLAGCKQNSDQPNGTVNDSDAFPVCS
ncbi:MAG: hypothetical protein KME60_14270 [Cyanomargarita calcarea GSE-NOS-MK-12-04C]|jgi:hypothetical protein|uniref:Lasso peptide n=1 Tax=Cyanomargarita calcarea GSE-NOS-MK-12-04C TaxID=2839659 RepID=A0A951QMN2_9CYAN|nr:hypothetical protein [Cyanomargarita calcarea GSE-NOS-MK-12-04C]